MIFQIRICRSPYPQEYLPSIAFVAGRPHVIKFILAAIVRFLQSDTIKRARRETHTLGAINEGVGGRSLLVFY
jgi:hypothetical protein